MVAFRRVASITVDRPAEVFDIETTPHHNFVASGFIVHNCTFCSKSIYGNTLRLRSPENVAEEIELLYRDWGVREVHLCDDTFNANRHWASNMLDLIIKKGYPKKMVFRVALRVNQNILDPELLKHLKAAGVWFIYYGVENGNQAMLDHMKKGITIEEVKRAFVLARKVGLKTEAFFIIGMPGETVRTVQESYELYKDIKPFWGGFSRAMPFPGTLFTKEVKEYGHLLCEDYDQFNPTRTVVRTDTMTAQDIDYWVNTMNGKARWSKVQHPKQVFYALKDNLYGLGNKKKGITI